MGGDSSTKQTQNQKQKQKQQQQSVSAPYKPTQPALQDIISQAKGINPVNTSGFSQGLMNYGQGLLPAAQGGINQLGNIASGSFVGQNDPELQSLLGTINTDVMHQINGQFDQAGRSVGGQYANAVARGLSSGLAAPLLQNLQFGRGAQANAAGALSGLGAQAPGFLNAAAASPYAGLNAYSNLLLPIAGLGGQVNSSGNSIGNTTGMSNTTQSSNPWQTALGAGLGGVGLLGGTGAFGTGGWLNFA